METTRRGFIPLHAMRSKKVPSERHRALAVPFAVLGSGCGALLLGLAGACFALAFDEHAGHVGFIMGAGVGLVAGFSASWQAALSFLGRRG